MDKLQFHGSLLSSEWRKGSGVCSNFDTGLYEWRRQDWHWILMGKCIQPLVRLKRIWEG